VADTNNHVIRVVDLEAGTVSSVSFANPDALRADREAVVAAVPFTGDEVILDPQTVVPGEGTLTLHLDIPEGYKINELATSTVTWRSESAVAGIDAELATQEITDAARSITVPVMLAEGDADLAAELMVFYCEAVNQSLCFVEMAKIILPVRVRADGAGHELGITYTIVPPVAGQ